MALFGLIGLNETKNLDIRPVDLTKLEDGTYTGSYRKSRWKYDVTVTVKNHKITSIKNTNKLPNKGVEKIVAGAIQAIMDKQSVEIDVVSGASANTRGFQKAVERALSARSVNSEQ